MPYRDLRNSPTRLRYTMTAGDVLGENSLAPGELALDATEGKLSYLDASGQVAEIRATDDNNPYVLPKTPGVITLGVFFGANSNPEFKVSNAGGTKCCAIQWPDGSVDIGQGTHVFTKPVGAIGPAYIKLWPCVSTDDATISSTFGISGIEETANSTGTLHYYQDIGGGEQMKYFGTLVLIGDVGNNVYDVDMSGTGFGGAAVPNRVELKNGKRVSLRGRGATSGKANVTIESSEEPQIEWSTLPAIGDLTITTDSDSPSGTYVLYGLEPGSQTIVINGFHNVTNLAFQNGFTCKSLDVQNNGLTTDGLLALGKTLGVVSGGTIKYAGNPGAEGFDPSVFTSKGWVVA